MAGRPREFDRTEVVEKAVDVFWAQGYEATSVDDLTEAMGIGRGSLYNEFGGKHALFIEALGCYGQDRNAHLEEILSVAPSARAGIEAVLRRSVERLWGDRSRRGCLLVNSAAELASSDADVAARARQAYERFARSFHDALDRAVRDGEVDRDLPVVAAANHLAATLVGLRLLSKFASRKAADDIVTAALRTLDCR